MDETGREVHCGFAQCELQAIEMWSVGLAVVVEMVLSQVLSPSLPALLSNRFYASNSTFPAAPVEAILNLLYMQMESSAEAFDPAALSVIPEDSAEWLPDSLPTSPKQIQTTGRRSTNRNEKDLTPTSASTISTRRSTLKSQGEVLITQWQAKNGRVSELVNRQHCSCLCTVF